MPGYFSGFRPLPVKVLRGVPNHYTYREKLRAKWMRKGYAVRFEGSAHA